MIRLANDVNGFFDGNDTNMKYISATKYPKQNTKYIGKWTALRYISEYNDMLAYITYTDGKSQVFKRNNKFYYDSSFEFEVPKKDRNGNDIIISEVLRNAAVNNRHVIDRRYFPSATINNSGVTTLFQILRYDLEAPNKVILRSKNNEVIVMTSTEFNNIYDLEDSDMMKRINKVASLKNVTYISPNITTDEDEFFNHYNNEKINIYPLQNDELLGMNIYTEFELDLFDENLTFEDNQMSKYTLKDINLDRVTEEDGEYRYIDNLNDVVPEENLPVSEKYNNRFEFTPRMRTNLIKNDSELKGFPDVVLQSFSQTYDVHLKNKTIDTPRRAINRGVIIRADIGSSDIPYLVAVEYTNNGLRVVCSDEARFFYKSENINHLLDNLEIADIFNNYDLVKD